MDGNIFHTSVIPEALFLHSNLPKELVCHCSSVELPLFQHSLSFTYQLSNVHPLYYSFPLYTLFTVIVTHSPHMSRPSQSTTHYPFIHSTFAFSLQLQPYLTTHIYFHYFLHSILTTTCISYKAHFHCMYL